MAGWFNRYGQPPQNSVTVTYVAVTYGDKHGDTVLCKVGYGDDYAQAVADADSQVGPGEWLRLCVSQPSSILADLQNAGRHRKPHGYTRKGEGKRFVVPFVAGEPPAEVRA